MLKSKYLQASSLAGYGIILTTLNQVFDINEAGAVGETLVSEAAAGSGPVGILVAAVLAGLASILKDEKK